MSRRTEMLGSTIQRELALFIMRQLNDPRLPTIVSITRVQVTEDLEYADVYVSVMGSEGQQTAALNALKHSSGLMRTRLTKSLSIRHSPFIRFQLDVKLKKELEILALIDKANRESRPSIDAEAVENSDPNGEEAAPLDASVLPSTEAPAHADAKPE